MTAPTQLDKFESFKALHARPGIFVMPNPWNAGSARMLTALDFEALATTSAGYAFSAGLPDSAAAVTRDGVLENAREIVKATHLPVSADLLNGFGDAPRTCAETIRLASATGLVGGSIEDATGNDTDPIYAFNHAVERVAAACEAARGLPFLLTARCENFLNNRPDLDDTIKRLQAFAAAGAHVLYAPGLPSIDAIRAVCSAVDRPVNALAAAAYTLDELLDAGVKRVSVGGAFTRTAFAAFMRAAREVKEKGTFTFANDALSHAELNSYMVAPKP
jgi:2-methylisocitrate lyase-like PEP mutase family enzyme